MSGASDEVVRRLRGARVSDLFAPETGATAEADPLDLPLYDLAGAILQKPVYEILGANGPTRLPIYSGAIYMDDLMPFYCAHLGAGVGNVLIVEGIPGTGTGLDYTEFKIENGEIVVPRIPGFGIVRA